MAKEHREKATAGRPAGAVPARRKVTRATKETPQPTVIEAGKAKLSDARSPLVIHVTDEQAKQIADFTAQTRR